MALACASPRSGADGVAYVGRLLERALGDITGVPPRAVDLEPAAPGRLSLLQRVRFTGRVVAPQVGGLVDWVFYNHVGIARAQRVAPRRVARPYAVFVHGIEVWGTPLDAERRGVLRDARIVVANSRLTADRVEALYPELRVTPCPLALIQGGYDGEPVNLQLLSRVRQRSALIVGRMSAAERYKGHDELFDCWLAVQALAPGAQLVVAGDGDDAARLAAKVRALGLADDVLFCGRVSDATLEALFERCAVFVLPSRGEGFGVVYLQAMAAGRACIAGADDAGREVVEDGVTGVVVDPRDGRALAAAVGSLLADPQRCAAMGLAGRRRVRQHYAYERFRDALGEALAGAFGREGGR